MLTRFFYTLRAAGLQPSVTEFLALLEALQAGLAALSLDEFYLLARTCLIKDETRYDRYDRAFSTFFQGIGEISLEQFGDVPDEWLRRHADLLLSDEEKARIEALGGWDKLMETLRQRIEEQKEQHHGGNRWIGTGGTSPFGHSGYHPEGVRIGGASKNRRAVKVWEQRDYRNLDDTRELGTRDIKLALRQLRRLARTGVEDELDLDGTIRATARNAGLLDLKMTPQRHNAVKILLLLDVGGSMDDHIKLCEEVFSAARSEFKHLEHFYFHNFVYEKLWRDNTRRHQLPMPTLELLHKYPADYKLIFVGDASMSPYEILQPGGSIEGWNEEAGQVWIKRMLDVYSRAVWLNPIEQSHWNYTPSITLTQELMQGRMFPLTLQGLARAIDSLKGRKAS
ncbi:VWA domain-containing protein [Pseudolysobacter antarcticus]|uniref:VWA domain-containing protein n=1 Tax=Pseudolysobacter antarcticus TaxID=2511995 RepID=A0A411HPQ2_9GAMM|nr:VWA domain-containing protein [Pseudolysobacter antarcticus]QBB72481.1 VWA domain-containing protein [Pseudolysobacter antarcticus]